MKKNQNQKEKHKNDSDLLFIKNEAILEKYTIQNTVSAELEAGFYSEVLLNTPVSISADIVHGDFETLLICGNVFSSNVSM